MRILVFCDELDYSHFTFIYNEIKWLRSNNVEVHVVCERSGKLTEGESDYTIIPLPQNKFFRSLFWWANNRLLTFLVSPYRYYRGRKKIIDDYNPDIVHVHFGDTAVRLFFPLQKSFSKRPFLVSFHGFDASRMLEKGHYLDKLKVMLASPFAHSIYVSKHLGDNLLKKSVPINDDTSDLLYYGIDLNMFQRTVRRDTTVRTFLQISSFVEKKGHIYTINAFKKFIEKNKGKARLILGGDGPLREEIRNECKKIGLEDHVEFPGWVSRKDAVVFLNNADFFVHHSVTSREGDQEGLPNAIIEAMAMELPILSTFHSGIPELVEDGVNGYLVDEKDVETYACRMQQILTWPRLPRNREKVQQRFSLNAHTKELIGIYERIKANKTKD